MRPMNRPVLAALAGLAAAASTPAFAQPTGGGPMGGGMMMRDPYGNATIPRKDAEAQATADFVAMDTNGDSLLSLDELRAARPARPPRGAGDGPPKGPGNGGGGDPGMERMARMMDANGDGKVMRNEFVAGTMHRFDLMDSDHNGQLTPSERQAAMEAMRARMEERRRAMMAGGMGGNGD